MAGFLSGTGTLKYNGVTFPNQIEAEVSIIPVMDSTNRVRKYNAHTLRVKSVFHNALHASSDDGPITSTLDAGMDSLIASLTAPGGDLYFTGKGMGSAYAINTSKQDVAYGPHPRIESIRFIGDNRAIEVVWSVEVHLSACSTSPFGKLLELSYSMSWSIDESGLTTRTVTGQLEIPVKRSGSAQSATYRNITDIANRYRNMIRVAIPIGYKRSQSFSMSPDKKFLYFTFTDTEIPSDNPFFPGVIRPQLTYEVTSTEQGFALWQASLSGSIEVAFGHPRWIAFAAFAIIANNKQAASKFATPPPGADSASKSGIQIPTHFSFQEDVFGRSTSFNLTWNLICSWKDVLKASGLWAVAKETSWDAWRSSMAEQFSNTGVTKAVHNTSTSEDYLNDSCNSPTPITVGALNDRSPSDPQQTLFSMSCPKPENSWMLFQPQVDEVHDPNTVVHKQLLKPEQYDPEAINPNTSKYTNSGGDTTSPIIQRRNQSIYYVVFSGYAMRACYPIPKFTLKEYGGVKATLISGKGSTQYDTFRQRIIGQSTGPIHAAAWRQVYTLEGTPKNGDYNITAAKFQ